MKASRTVLSGVVAAVGLVAVVAVGGLAASGAARPSVAKSPPLPLASVGCSVGVAVGGENFEICKGEPADPTAGAVKATSVVVAGPPFPHPFEIGPGKPRLAGQPAPKPTPILLMQVSASLATAPASPTAIVLLSDWPAAGPGTVTLSVYLGSNVDACSSPPLMTKTAGAGWGGVPYEWSATFDGLGVGSYEVQAAFVGKAGPMSTPCGRAPLKVLALPGSGQ